MQDDVGERPQLALYPRRDKLVTHFGFLTVWHLCCLIHLSPEFEPVCLTDTDSILSHQYPVTNGAWGSQILPFLLPHQARKPKIKPNSHRQMNNEPLKDMGESKWVECNLLTYSGKYSGQEEYSHHPVSSCLLATWLIVRKWVVRVGSELEGWL